LTARHREIVSSFRLSLCGHAQRLRAVRPQGRDEDSAGISVRQRFRLYISMIYPLFFHDKTLTESETAGEALEEDGRRTIQGRRGTGEMSFPVQAIEHHWAMRD
jgi:hypothetical protein